MFNEIREALINDVEVYCNKNKRYFVEKQFIKYYNFFKNLNNQFTYELFGKIPSINMIGNKTINFIESAKSLDYHLNDDGDLSFVKVVIDMIITLDNETINIQSEAFLVLPYCYNEITIEYINSIKTDINHTWEDNNFYSHNNLRFKAIPFREDILDIINNASQLYDEFEQISKSPQDNFNKYIDNCKKKEKEIYKILNNYINSHPNKISKP
jgi:hypothetical protein